ncbi:MAG: B12-binding domain-containing radical SAM protein [Deltaproteobacteria bacterium]|nr:MAG: B12-binding domain-containing radical SAM protein [Deltaproteobacteria bacterium]
MKILLISANTLTSPYPVYPLGLDYVANAIGADHQVKIADMNDVGNYDSLGNIIRHFSPDIIGMSLRNADNTDTSDPRGFVGNYQELTAAIREYSDARLVLGGSGFTIFPAEFMKVLKADYGIIGEGERLALLLNALEKQEDVANIPGVITRDTEAHIPAPWDNSYFRNFDPESSHLRFYLRKGGMLNLQTKRGCQFKCIYCTYPHIEGKTLRCIPPNEVAETGLRLQNAGAKYFFVTDSAFNADYSHSIEVARAFIKAGVSVPWGAFFTPTNPPEDYYRILADAGLTHVEFGTDSLSDAILASYGKPFRADHVFNAHQSATDAGLYVAHYFLLGGPGENEYSLNETLSGVDKLDKSVLFFFCGMRIYPYTAIYDIAMKAGQISEGRNLLNPLFYQSESVHSEVIIQRVGEQAKGHINWIIGSGGEKNAKILSRMYERGHYGPLWEHLIR